MFIYYKYVKIFKFIKGEKNHRINYNKKIYKDIKVS